MLWHGNDSIAMAWDPQEHCQKAKRVAQASIARHQAANRKSAFQHREILWRSAHVVFALVHVSSTQRAYVAIVLARHASHQLAQHGREWYSTNAIMLLAFRRDAICLCAADECSGTRSLTVPTQSHHQSTYTTPAPPSPLLLLRQIFRYPAADLVERRAQYFSEIALLSRLATSSPLTYWKQESLPDTAYPTWPHKPHAPAQSSRMP